MPAAVFPWERRQDHARPLIRAAATIARAHALGEPIEAVLQDLGADRTVRAITRAAASPADLATAGWASELSPMATAFVGLSPASASSQLIAGGLQLNDIGPASQVSLPSYVVTASDAGGFVTPGSPIRSRKMSLSAGPTIGLRKLACIAHMTTESAQGSNVEAVTRFVLARASSLLLDNTILSTNVDDGTTPGGVLAAVVPLPPSAATGQAAFIEDVSSLVAAIAAAGGSAPMLVGDLAVISRAKLWAPPSFDLPLVASSAVAADTLIGIEGAAFATAFGGTPQITVGTESVLHEEDTTPTQLSVAGPAVAFPARSLWQTDSIALRMTLQLNWSMLAPGLVQFVENIVW